MTLSQKRQTKSQMKVHRESKIQGSWVKEGSSRKTGKSRRTMAAFFWEWRRPAYTNVRANENRLNCTFNAQPVTLDDYIDLQFPSTRGNIVHHVLLQEKKIPSLHKTLRHAFVETLVRCVLSLRNVFSLDGSRQQYLEQTPPNILFSSFYIHFVTMLLCASRLFPASPEGLGGKNTYLNRSLLYHSM